LDSKDEIEQVVFQGKTITEEIKQQMVREDNQTTHTQNRSDLITNGYNLSSFSFCLVLDET